jgi:O-antigen/teichoic acid export membrane protein
VSSFVVPLLVQINQYFIGALSSVEEITFYAVPYELLNGLWIIPGALVATLFPAYSSLKPTDEALTTEMYKRPLKYILLALGPLVIIIVTFAQDLLLIWQGPVIAERSTLALQILVIGVLINSLEWVPANLVMGVGRPDLIAKSHLVQLPIYLLLAYFLISRWGAMGAAAAFAIRVTFEAVLVFGVAGWLLPATRRALVDRYVLISIGWLGVLALAFVAIQALAITSWTRIGLTGVVLLVFAGIAWMWVLDDRDRRLVQSLLPGVQGAAA